MSFSLEDVGGLDGQRMLTSAGARADGQLVLLMRRCDGR